MNAVHHPDDSSDKPHDRQLTATEKGDIWADTSCCSAGRGRSRRAATPGAGITVHSRGDGIIVRITDQEGNWYEVFLDTTATNNLVEMLTDDPTVWGWRPPSEP